MTRKGQEVKFTPAEYNLLTFFLQNPDRAAFARHDSELGVGIRILSQHAYGGCPCGPAPPEAGERPQLSAALHHAAQGRIPVPALNDAPDCSDCGRQRDSAGRRCRLRSNSSRPRSAADSEPARGNRGDAGEWRRGGRDRDRPAPSSDRRVRLIRQLRSEPRFARLPILLISGDSDPGLPRRAMGIGADAFFPKPYSPSAVRRKLEQLLC